MDKSSKKFKDNLMYEPEIRFTAPEYDGMEAELGNLANKLVGIINDHSRNTIGKKAIPNPTDIEITPHVLDKPKFLVRAWHQTAAPTGMAGVLQPQILELTIDSNTEDLFLVTDAESTPQYLLTTREAFLMVGVGNLATMHSRFYDPTIISE